MNREASVITATVTSFLVAILGLGAAFGLDVTEDQKNAVIATVIPASGIILLIGPVIRQFVWSRQSVQNEVDNAAVTGQAKKIV